MGNPLEGSYKDQMKAVNEALEDWNKKVIGKDGGKDSRKACSQLKCILGFWYDYTKNPFRTTPKNYYLTFSRAECNDDNVQIAIERGLNVAVVFENLPKKFMGRKVINGDKTDLRFTDPKNVIVGLIPKGDAKKDTSGFVVR